ncbi:MAG: hypothetical protein ACLQBD_17035 [Syntrophobacteraceae bacterium]
MKELIDGLFGGSTGTEKMIQISDPPRLRSSGDGRIEVDGFAVSGTARMEIVGNSFPVWIMSGAAGEFTSLYSSYLEVPVAFLYMAFLTCMGTAVADCLTLDSEIKPQPRLYTLLLGESADTRKSTAITKTLGFFQESLGDAFQPCLGLGSAEGLQKVFNQKTSKNSKVQLCFDEFKQFVGKCKIEGSVLLPCVTSLFESNGYESQTKRSEFKIDSAYLSILAASTIQTYENTWDSAFTDIGFNNRLFVVIGSGERKFSIPRKIPEAEKQGVRNALKRVVHFSELNPELPITQEAGELYHKWYMSLEKSVHSKRLDAYAMRLMPLLAANDLLAQVDEGTARKVIALCDWQLAVRKLHDPIDADSKMAKMEAKIRRVIAIGPASDRDLRRKTNADRAGLWVYRTALDNLRRSREIGQDPKTKCWVAMG